MQPITLSPIVLILVCGGITLAVASALVFFAMIGEVNRKLPEDQQIAYIGGLPSKRAKITNQYRRFYPQGYLVQVLRVL